MKSIFTLMVVFACTCVAAQPCTPNSSSVSFNGTSGYVGFTSDNGLVISDSITIEAWINASQWAPTTAQGTIFCKHSWSNGEEGYVLRAGANGTLSFNIAGLDANSQPTSWKKVENLPGSMSLNTWYHVAGTFDGQHLRIYINGNQAADSAFTGGIVSPGSYPMAIGKLSDQPNGFLGRYWNGKLDEVRVWHRALPQSEIQANMNTHLNNPASQNALVGYWRFNENTGTITNDLSNNNNDGTLNGSTFTTQVPFSAALATPTVTYNGVLLSSTAAYTYQWHYINSPIPNATQQTYHPAVLGNYYVVITDVNGCSATSAVYTVLSVGINENAVEQFNIIYSSQKHSIRIVPLPDMSIERIVISDASGKTVWVNETSVGKELEFRLPEIANGIYFVSAFSTKELLTKKLGIYSDN